MIKSSFVWKYRVLATELLITLGKSVDIDLFFVFITSFYIKGNQYIRDVPVIGYIHSSTLDFYILLIISVTIYYEHLKRILILV